MLHGRFFLTIIGLLTLAAPILTAGEDVPAGFSPLFNGKNLSGWKVFGGNAQAWGVENGILYVARPARTRPGGREEPYWLMTEKEFGDFELRLEFRVPPNGNSGVALRAPRTGDPARDGMEIQILDDNAPAHKKIRPDRYTGSLYGLAAPSRKASNPAGQWNHYRIICRGRQVTIALNGIEIVDANLATLEKQHAKQHPGLLNRKGHIGVQSHDGNVQFRNLFVKELD